MRRFLSTALFILALAAVGLAAAELSPLTPGEAALIGDTIYALSDSRYVAAPTLWLSVVGQRADGDTADGTADSAVGTGAQLRGALFTVVALTADGVETAYPDPDNPGQPWLIEYKGIPIPLRLPIGPALYLRQTAAPRGYKPADERVPLTDAAAFGSILTVENELTGGLFRLRADQRIDYRLTDARGESVASGTLEKGGVISELLDVGEYTLGVAAPNGYITPAPASIEIRKGALTEYSFVGELLPRASIDVRSVSFESDGSRAVRPLEGERIVFSPTDGAEPIVLVTGSDGVARREGESGLPAFQPGAYTIQTNLEPPAAVELRANDIYERSIVANDGTGQVRVRADAYIGKDELSPLAGARFTLERLSGSTDTENAPALLESREDGQVWLSGLPAGAYMLKPALAPEGYTALDSELTIEIQGGEETFISAAFSKNAVVSVRKAGRLIDIKTGSVSDAASYDSLDAAYEAFDSEGRLIGALPGVSLPALPEGSSYFLRESRASDGYQPDPEIRAIVAYPGDVISVDAFVDSELGLFRMRHIARGSGAALAGGAFLLEALDQNQPAAYEFIADDGGLFNLEQPLPPGEYRLSLIEAAPGAMADPSVYPTYIDITIEPWLDGLGAPADPNAAYTFESEPIPAAVASPEPPAIDASVSEITRDGERSFTINIKPSNIPLPIEGECVELALLPGAENEPASRAQNGISVESLRIPAVGAEGVVQTATIYKYINNEWIDGGTHSLPAEISFDDILVPVTRVRILFGEYTQRFIGLSDQLDGDAPTVENGAVSGAPAFDLPDDYTISASIRVLPQYAHPEYGGSSTLVASARALSVVPIRTGEDKWRYAASPTDAAQLDITMIAPVVPANAATGVVFEDRNENGARDADEPGVPYVRAAARSADGDLIGEALSDASGVFVAAHNYDNLNFILDDVSFDEIHLRTETRFAARGRGGAEIAVVPESALVLEIEGASEFNDAARENPVMAAALRNGEVVAETLISGLGSFELGGLSSGAYEIRVDLPEGFIFSDDYLPEVVLPYAGAANKQITITRAAVASGRVSIDTADAGADPSAIVGIPIILTRVGGDIVYGTTTNDQGEWELRTVRPGIYAVEWRLPEGMIPVSDYISAADYSGFAETALIAGERTELGISIARASSIKGRAEDSAGKGVSGIYVYARSANGAEYTSLTDSSGEFAFDGIPRGDYTIEPAFPEGMILYDGATRVSPAPGETVNLSWLAFYPASVSGSVWIDLDNDGYIRQDADAPLEGAELILLDAQGRTVAEARSDAEGAFQMDRLPPGEARLSVEAPDGMVFAENPGGVDRLFEAIDYSGALSRAFTLEPGRTFDASRIGMVRAGVIAGLVWQDLNGDGARDAVEPPISGAEIILYKDGARVRAAISDTSGGYSFENVRPGVYQAAIAVPDGFAPPRDENTQGTVTNQAEPISFEARLSAAISPSNGRSEPASVDFALAPLCALPGFARLTDGAPLPGMRVSIVSPDGRELAYSVTDIDGAFRIERVRPGAYTLRYELPNGAYAFADSDAAYMEEAVDVRSGAPQNRFAPAVVALASLRGELFADANGDGARAAGEIALGGAAMTLSQFGNIIYQTDCGSDGVFRFDNIRPGVYTLGGEPPDGWRWSAGDNPAWVVELDEGESFGFGSLGAYRPGSISGKLLLDRGADGRLERDDSLTGASIVLSRDRQAVASAYLDDTGAFSFDALAPGVYELTAALPDNMLFADAGLFEGLGARLDAGTATSAPITLNMGEALKLDDIGAVISGSVSGRLWVDTQYNGLFDMGEQPLSGALVTLLDELDQAAAQAQTGTDGIYRMADIRPGEYRLHFALPGGLIFSEQAEGGSIAPSANARQAFSAPFRVAPGQAAEDRHAAAIEPGSLNGEIYLDANANGVKDVGEAPLQNIIIKLYDLYGNELTAQSGADGQYRFESMRPGAYNISYEWPNNLIQTTPPDGSIELEMGSVRGDVRAGAAIASAIECVAFEDVDSDGYFTAADHTIEGAAVTLISADGEISAAADANGTALFERLLPGTYTVRVELPDSYVFTRRRADGSLCEALDSNISATPPFELRMGEMARVPAGGVRSGAIGDYAWMDENFNGLQDEGEPGLPNIAITLERGADGEWAVAAQTVTDGNGYYEFSPVRPGTYRLIAEAPGGAYPAKPIADLPEINSKLVFRTGERIVSEMFLLGSAQHARNQDIGFVDARQAGLRGWTVSDNGMIYDGTYTAEVGEPADVAAMARPSVGEPIGIIGMVWRDDDGNGAYDPGEPLIEDVKIILNWEGLEGNDTSFDQRADAQTDGEGSFYMTAPRSDRIGIRAILPEGAVFEDGEREREVSIDVMADEYIVRIDLAARQE
ncbi:MAG: carboxypeptidase regulatory-like domain-containing protein [Oscillospiraceae bacterium]|jgi:protocatechuate 3,4-dioxygenase beta subunit|nr:carboxypeptidase regulatory-like domain-containing protein [Oscillospiraceae bacterium]